MRRPILWKLAGPLLVLALIAASCGSGDNSKESSSTTSGKGDAAVACDSPGVSADTIKVGVELTKTGPSQGAYAPMLPGIEARVAYQNEQLGGVGGRQLKLEVADDASDPTKGPQVARELVERDGVFGVIMGAVSDGPAGPYLKQNGVPVTGFNASTAWGKYDNYFGFSGGNAATPTAVTTGGKFLKSKDVTKLGALTYAFPAALDAAKQYLTSFETATGHKGVLQGDAPVGNADWSVQAQKLKDVGIDALYLPMALQDAAGAYQAVLQAGVKLKAVIFPSGYGPTALKQLGSKLDGASFTIQYAPLGEKTDAQKKMLSALEKYGQGITIENGLVDDPVVIGWLSADSFIKGLGVAGKCPTRESFIKNLRAVTDYDGGGLLDPPVDYTKSLGRPYLTCTYFVTVKDGAFVTEKPAPLCGEIIKQ